jgi:hypothetical protein
MDFFDHSILYDELMYHNFVILVKIFFKMSKASLI